MKLLFSFFNLFVYALSGMPLYIGPVGRFGGGNANTQQPQVMGPKGSYLQYLRNKYINRNDIIITESVLKSNVQMPNAAIGQIQFGFQTNNNEVPMLPVDRRLEQSDTFEVYGMMFSIYTLSATTTASLVTSPNVIYSSAIHEYFPNPNVFSGTTTGISEAANLYAIYAGGLYVKIGATVYYEWLDMRNFLNVGITQQGVAVSTVATTGVVPATSVVPDHLKQGVTPMFMINGSAKNQITWNMSGNETAPLCPNLPITSVGMVRANFMCLTLLGFQVQNGAIQPVNTKARM